MTIRLIFKLPLYFNINLVLTIHEMYSKVIHYNVSDQRFKNQLKEAGQGYCACVIQSDRTSAHAIKYTRCHV